ncbi:MAG TPA: branched-chain amino acid ABC transporter ATP-binding protein/permease [Frankiaceae bacterium]|nr:branched-chain amino acid ABC transporter ATP-binding protein/permease [Frankiaceae bacterium]
MSAVDLARDLYLLLAALGLNLAVGYAGQPVLGQGAFVAVGAYGTFLLAGTLPLGLAVLVAVAGAAGLGWLVAYGAARLHGAFLALGTWALAWLAVAVLAAFPGRFGGEQGLLRAAPATLVSPSLGLSWRLTPRWHVAFAVLLCAGLVLVTRALGRGPLGLELAALRQGPEAAASVGVRGASLRRNALAAAAAFGALAGALTGVLLGVVAPSSVAPLLSIQLFVAVLIGGTASPYGPIAGIALVLLLPDRGRGVGLLTALLLVAALALRDPIRRRLPSWSRPPRREPEPAALPVAERGGDVLLDASGLRKRYGGLAALDGVDLTLRAGEVHALLGPNGSGKTTLLRVLAGATAADGGRVVVGGRDVTALGQEERVRAGVARTFQDTVLFPGLDVRGNVAVGARAVAGGSFARTLLRTPSARRDDARVAAAGALALRDAELPPGAKPAELPYGEQRILQVARAAATNATVLLLDEPAAGMSAAETARLATLLRALAGNGRAVLVVEHNVRFVSAVADRVTVLAAGRVLAEGTPDEVRADPAVREAYLGRPA